MSNKTETNVGGIVGFHNGTTKLEIDGCVNNADITCNVIGLQPSIGGIVGKTKSNNTIVKNSVNMGDIILVKNGTVENHNVGGIIGYSEGVITVNGCANFGDITSEDEMGCSIGGIIGAPSPAITATNVQSITDCLSAGDISVKSSYPGGIVGNYQRQNLKLTRCVVLGTVTKLAAGSNGAYGGALIGNVNNSLNITFEDCYYNNAYKPLPTWVGIRADYGKASFTVKVTGKDDVYVEYTSGGNPSAVTNALKAGGAMSKASMSDLNAIQNLTALDWANVTDNGWKLEKVDGQNIPMPTAVAELIAEEVVEKDNGVDYKGVQVATDKGAVRFVATVDDLDRDNIGFEVLVIKNGAHATYTLETETVYTSLLYNDLTKPEGEQSTEYSVDGKFLCALAFTDIPASGTVTFVVKTFTETEGVRTYDDTRVVSVNNGNVYTYIR